MRSAIAVLLIGIVAGCSRQQEAKKTSAMSPQQPESSFAVSLRQVQRTARAAVDKGIPVPREATSLGGLTRVDALLFEKDDVLLVGDRETGWPSFELDHLAVALRNALGSLQDYHGVLGITIDPRPGSDPWRIQDVRSFGGPHNTSLSHLFFEIDYATKRAGAGYERLPGVQSSFELSPVATCEGGKGHSAAHRYWSRPSIPRRRALKKAKARSRSRGR